MGSIVRSTKRKVNRENMVELELTSWELLQLYMVVGVQSGNAAEMRKWWHILDAIEPDDAEKEQLGWKLVNEADIGLIPKDFDHEIVVELSKIDFDWLVKVVREYKGWQAGGFGRGNRCRLKGLFDKLGID